MGEDNVIMFRGGGPEPLTLEGVQDRMSAIREVYVDAAVEQTAQCMVEALYAGGFDVCDETLEKDMALVTMAIKSLLMKSRGDHHTLQDFAQDMFWTDDDGYVYLRTSEEIAT